MGVYHNSFENDRIRIIGNICRSSAYCTKSSNTNNFFYIRNTRKVVSFFFSFTCKKLIMAQIEIDNNTIPSDHVEEVQLTR